MTRGGHIKRTAAQSGGSTSWSQNGSVASPGCAMSAACTASSDLDLSACNRGGAITGTGAFRCFGDAKAVLHGVVGTTCTRPLLALSANQRLRS